MSKLLPYFTKLCLFFTKGWLMKIVAFVPVKLNNERFPGKNLKQFADGKVLLTYFLEKLSKIDLLDELYVFCSDENIKNYLTRKAIFLKRPKYLDTKEATPQNIINEFMRRVNDADIYCVCHCTNPLVSTEHFRETINALVQKNFDSAFTAKKIQKLFWTQKKEPLNFDATNIPRTQDLPPLYEEIPAIYAFRKEMFIETQRRIGFNPRITQISEIESVDIDYPQDFIIANSIYMNKHKFNLD